MKLSTLSRYSLAVEMLSIDARISIVSKQTGFSHDVLREMYAEMHDSSPSAGPLKSSSNFFLKSYRLTKESTVYAFFFRIGDSADFHRRVISAYRYYVSYISKLSKSPPLLDFSDAWVLSEWIDAGVIKLVRCSYCRSAKLITNELRHHVCCVCKS
jgi:flagellar transcriptional activator FlhC